MTDRAPSPLLRYWPALVWATVAVAFTLSVASMNAVKSVDEPLGRTFWYSGVEWLLYGALSPLVVWATRRVRFARGDWLRTGGVLLASWLAFHFLVWLLFSAGEFLFRIGPADRVFPSFTTMYVMYLTKRAALTALVFAGIVVVMRTVALAELARERERRTTQLEGALAKARLEVLRGQLQPHFLFNALNTVSSLVHAEPEKAESVLARIGDLLRMTLQEGNAPVITLDREVAFLERYLDIQQLRFADRLRVELDVPDATRAALVPTLLLQPLAENAIRHGIEPRPEGGTLRLRAARDGDTLHLELHDDGVGIAADGTNGHDTAGCGVGLANTRQRLEELYGARHRFTVSADPAGGTRVVIRLPWQVADA